jgi:16S rRNA (cytidine1402-2'-O)-methyltransferase
VPGTLYVIATPLGNLEDFPRRGVEILRRVHRVACEDTRRTARLLTRFEIDTPTLSCHRFNERARLEPVLDRLRSGEDVALVSDGGTPGISDPGALLVRAAAQAGIRVCPVPGPSAAATLLSASGLPADRYVFEGFLPHRPGERRRRLRELANETRTLVLFEAPHRILATLEDLAGIFGDRPIVLGRELTKLHETILRGTASEVAERIGSPVKGEITLAVAGAPAGARTGDLDPHARRVLEAWRRALEEESGDRRAALRRAGRALGMGRAELYRALAELGQETDGK